MTEMRNTKTPMTIGQTIAHQVGPVVIRLQRTHFTYTVVVEQGTHRVAELSRAFVAETTARSHARGIAQALNASWTIERIVEVASITAPRLAPAAKGTATKVSDPQHIVLRIAREHGFVGRGRIQDGRAPEPTLKALARRGYLTLTVKMDGRRRIVIGGMLLGLGARRLAELETGGPDLPRLQS